MTGLGTWIHSLAMSFSGSLLNLSLLLFREPLIVDPQTHISAHDRALIHVQFHDMRGPEWNRGPAMYIISPADYNTVEDMDGSRVVGDEVNASQVIPTATAAEKMWAPTITCNFPEKVVLTRAAALAKCSHDHLTACLMRGARNSWIAAFQESSQSLSSFSALLRVRSCFVTDLGCSSTNMDFSIPNAHSNLDQLLTPFERSLQSRFSGPIELRMKLYKNLVLERDTIVSVEAFSIACFTNRPCALIFYFSFFYSMNGIQCDLLSMPFVQSTMNMQCFFTMNSPQKSSPWYGGRVHSNRTLFRSVHQSSSVQYLNCGKMTAL